MEHVENMDEAKKETELSAVDRPIPADSQHVHFGGGQTETSIELPPGPHELQLVLGDRLHIPHDPPVASERIAITVIGGSHCPALSCRMAAARS